MQILELSDTDMNIIVISKFIKLVTRRSISAKNQDVQKKKQRETLNQKNIITENKNSVSGVESTVE